MEDIAELVGGVDDRGAAVAEDARLLHTQDWMQIQCCLGAENSAAFSQTWPIQNMKI